MPSTSALVGGLMLPLEVGDVDERVADPALDVISDFLAWHITNDANDKLDSLNGSPKPSIGEYNGRASVHLFDPEEQPQRFMRLPVPSLFVFRTGDSELRHVTDIYDYLITTVGVWWIYEDFPQDSPKERRDALLNAVLASMARAIERQRHPSYSYNGGVAGRPLWELVVDEGTRDNFACAFVSGRPTRFRVASDARGERDFPGRAWREYPAVRARLQISERIEQQTPEFPGDLLGDIALTINATGGEAEPDEHMIRYLPSSDGAEEL